jgi:hypothetical protein
MVSLESGRKRRKRLSQALLVWTIAAVTESIVFAINLMTSAGNPRHVGHGASLLVVVQPIASVGFPVALQMVASADGLARGMKNWARMCFAVSAGAWLTYDMAGLHRLLPPLAPVTLGSVSLASLVPVGWWMRNLELVVTAVLIRQIGNGHNQAAAAGRRWMTGLVCCIILAVTTKSVALLVFQHVVAQGPGNASRFVLFASISVASQVTQHVATVAAGVLAVARLGIDRRATLAA